MKQVNNIEYFQEQTGTDSLTTPLTKMLVWQAWNIGPGKWHYWRDLDNIVTKISPLKILLSSNECTPWITECLERSGNECILSYIYLLFAP